MQRCWLLCVLLIACDNGSNSELLGPSGPATLSPDCAPDDGPALTLRIGPGVACGEHFVAPDEPWVSISMWAELPQTDGDALENRAGSWWYYDGGAANGHAVTRGTVTFHRYSPGGPASGSYTIVLENGAERSGSFDATFCDEDPECG